MMGVSRRTDRSSMVVVNTPLSLVALILVLSLPSLHSAPPFPGRTSKPNQCDIIRPCRPGQASALGYNSGRYTYEFESEIETAVTLANPESRKSKVKAEVIITAFTPCDFTLQVKSLSVATSRDGKFEAVEGVKENLVRFTLHDGIIGSVCVSDDEPTWTGNVKRAIVSLLQNKALNGITDNEVIESDISGRCPTKYTINGNTYVKTKNLQACSHRDGGDVTHFGVPYEVNSKANSYPGIKSEQSCEQTLENQIIKSVRCTETHTVRKSIASNATPQIKTTVTTTLTLKGSLPGAPRIAPPPDLIKSSIYFDHKSNINDQATKEDSVQEIREAVERITNNIRPDGVTSEVPVLFLGLKNSFHDATPEAVETVYNEITSGSLPASQKEKLKKLYVDAAADAASDGTIALLAKLVKQGEVDKATKYKFYLHTTYAGHPTEVALNAVLPLLEGSGADVRKKALLTASGLAHQYCKITNRNCGQVPEYRAIVDRLAAIVTENVGDKSETGHENTLTALQALGNLDSLTSAAVGAISGVLDGHCDWFRTRALEAFRRDPCQSELKQKAQSIFANIEAPAHVRISAYLANVRCLEPADAKVIQRVLDQEESIQVGGFIQSHLKNLALSSSPSSAALQSAARQLTLNLRFPKELRRFSRNLQASLFNSDVNLGYLAEGNVIFSKDSFIPKQLSGNLTLDIFGSSYNFIEVGAYLDNLDGLQESLLGPQGKFPIRQEIDSQALINRILKRRTKREIGPVSLQDSGIEPIRSQVPVNDRSNEPSTIDLYIRVFGTTLRTVTVDPKNAGEALKKLREKVGDLLRAPTRELDVTNPILFLNDEFVVPTGSGLALTTLAEGLTVPTVDYARKFQPKSESSPMEFHLKVITNSATSIKLRQSVVGGPFEQGLQFEGSLRTGGAIEIKVTAGEGLEAKVNLPNEKVRALELSTQVFWVQKGLGQPEVKAPFRPQLAVQPGPEDCGSSPLNKLLGYAGLKYCFISNVDISRNNPDPILLRGKQYLSVSLEKTEASMEGYSLVYSRKKDGNDREYKIELDTPGSTTNRKVTVVAESKRNDAADGMTRKTEISLTSPYKSGNVKVELEETNLSDLKGLVARWTHNSGTVTLTAQLGMKRDGNSITYEPLLRLEHPDRAGKTETDDFIAGTVQREVGRKLSFNLRSNALLHLYTKNPEGGLLLRGTLEADRNGDDYKIQITDLAVGAPNQDYLNINGVTERQGEGQQKTDLTVKYGPKLDYTTTYKRELQREGDNKYKLDLKIASDAAWFLNVDLSSNVDRNKESGTYDSLHKLTYGPHDRPRLVVSSQSNAVVSSRRDFDLQNKLKFFFPVRNQASDTYDLSLSTHVKYSEAEQLVDIQFLSGEGGARAKVGVNFNRKAANNNDFTANILVKTEKRGGELGITRTTLTDDESKQYTASYKYEILLRSTTLKLNENSVTIVRLSNKPEKRALVVNSQVTSTSDRSPLNGLSLELQVKSVLDKHAVALAIKRNADEFITLDSKVLKGPSSTDPQVSIKAFLVNTLNLELNRQVPSENEATTKVKAEILRTGRTITFEGSRKREGDVHNVNLDLKWDATKDETQSIQIQSVTKITKGSIIVDSKNDITVIGKSLRINVGARIPDSLRNGEHSLSLDVVGVDGKNYKIDYINSIAIAPELRTSNAKLSLNVPDAPPTEIQFQLKSQNPNIREGIFDVTTEVQVVQNGAVSQSVSAQVASVKEGSQRSVTAKLDLGGQKFPEQIALEAVVKAGPNRGGVKATWQFGSTSSGIEVNGESSVAEDAKSRQVTFKLTNLPGVRYQVIEGRLAGKEGLGGELNIQKEREIRADGKTLLSYRYGAKHQNGQLRASAQLTYKNKQLLNANLKGTATRDNIDVTGKLSGESFNISVLTKIQPVAFPIGEVKFEIESSAPTVAGLTVKAQNTAEGKYSGGVTLNYQQKTASITGELTNTETECGLSLALSGPNVGDVEAGLKLVKVGGDGQQVSGRLTLRGKTVAVTGTSKKTDAGYVGTLEVEVPKQDVGKGIYALALAVNGNRRTLKVTESDSTGQLEHLSLDYTVQQNGNSRIHEGTYSTDILHLVYTEDPPRIQGTFRTEHSKLEEASDGEIGREFKLQVKLSTNPQINPEKHAELLKALRIIDANEINVQLKATNREFHAYGQVLGGNSPGSGDIQLKLAPKGVSPRVYIAKAVFVHDGGVTEGFDSQTTGTLDPYSVEHTTKLYFGSESSDVISLNIKGQMKRGEDRCQGSIDLNLPARQISASLVRQPKSMEFNAWLDKARQPDQKLNVVAQFDKLQTSDGAEGYQYELQISHPTLPKALVVKRKVVRFGRLVVHDSVTELDIFQDTTNKILIKAKANFASEDRKELVIDLVLKSDGLGLEVQASGSANLESREADLQYSFKRPNGEVKTRNVHIVASRTVQSISVGEVSNPEILLSRTVRNLGDHRRRRSTDFSGGRDVRYEIKLPGMTDTRVIDVHLHTSLPPHLNIKTFATGQGRSYEVALGYPTERQFLVGFYKHQGTATTNLAQLSITLNTTTLILAKANWDKEGLKQFAQAAKERLQGTEDRLEDTFDAYVDQVTQDVQETFNKISTALPDCSPFRSHIRSELEKIREEIKNNPAFNRARGYIRVVTEATKDLADFFEEMADSLAKFPEHLKTLSQSSPALVKRYEKIIRRLRNTVGAIIANTLRTVRPIIQQISELIKQLTDKIQFAQSRASNAVTQVRAASNNALAKLIELLISRADELSGRIQESELRPELKEIASAVLNFIVARLKGENPDPEALVAQIRAQLKKLASEVLTIDLENGEVAVPIPLPRPINSLLDVRTAILNALPSSKSVIPYRNRLLKPLEVIRQAVKDNLKTNPLTAITRALRTNVPPHPARAYIIGSQYLITFDGKLIHLEGRCQYLLVADFPKTDFKVAIQFHNVDGVIKKTIVAGDSDEEATISPDNVVEAHGTGGPHIALIEEEDAIGFNLQEHDVTVVCSKSHDVCTVNLLNGYLFGKVGGLLGNYNNEQYDDLRTPAGKKTSSEEEFASAWKLDSQCTEEPVPEHAAVSSAARDACSTAFSSWRSPLRSCHKYSEPQEFESICNRLTTEKGWTVQEAVCTSLTAYEQTCQGVSLFSNPFTSSVLPKGGCGVF